MTPEQEARLLRVEQLLAALVRSDRVLMHKTLQFDEARNIQFGTVTGTQIGVTTLDKLAFFGGTPVVAQAGGAGTASTSWSGTEQAMLNNAYHALRNYNLLVG